MRQVAYLVHAYCSMGSISYAIPKGTFNSICKFEM